jgi:hypothetical protein
LKDCLLSAFKIEDIPNNMVLEATVICMDNSEFVRNSDYAPTRLQVLKQCQKLCKFLY